MPFCPFCGTPVKEQHRFCPSCGKELEPIPVKENPGPSATQPKPAQPWSTPPPPVHSPSVTQGPPPMPAAAPHGETVRIIIPNLMVSKSLGRSDTYNLLVTERRSIFAKLTNEIMGETVKMRRAKAEAEGKGFFGKWKAQMQGFTYTDWYNNKAPDQALNETPGNYALENAAIRNIRVNEDSDDEGGMTQYYVEITTATGKLNFKMQYDPKKLFETAYGAA